MTNRVLLDESGLFISAPGVDVLTADQKSLAFDSRYPMPKIWTSGSVGISMNNAYLAQSSRVYYGKTFTRPPTIFYYIVLSYNGANTSRFAYRRYSLGSPVYYSSFVSSIGRDSVVWTIRSRNGPNNTDTFSGTIHYIVLED